MESSAGSFVIDPDAPTDHVEGAVFTQQQRDALAERIDRVILERRRIGIAKRMHARLRQLQSLERSRDRYQPSAENGCETRLNAG